MGVEEAISGMRSHPSEKPDQSEIGDDDEDEEGVGSDCSETFFECEEDEQGFLYKDSYFEDEESMEYVYDPMKLSLHSSYSSQSPFPSSPHQIPPSYGSPFPVTLGPPSPQQWGPSLLGSSTLNQTQCSDCGAPGPDQNEDCTGQVAWQWRNFNKALALLTMVKNVTNQYRLGTFQAFTGNLLVLFINKHLGSDSELGPF